MAEGIHELWVQSPVKYRHFGRVERFALGGALQDEKLQQSACPSKLKRDPCGVKLLRIKERNAMLTTKHLVGS